MHSMTVKIALKCCVYGINWFDSKLNDDVENGSFAEESRLAVAIDAGE